MTLDEAIEHSDSRGRADDSECGREHAQLAEWLRELRERRAEDDGDLRYIKNGERVDPP